MANNINSKHQKVGGKSTGTNADYKRDVIDKQVALMQKRGIWKKPSR